MFQAQSVKPLLNLPTSYVNFRAICSYSGSKLFSSLIKNYEIKKNFWAESRNFTSYSEYYIFTSLSKFYITAV